MKPISKISQSCEENESFGKFKKIIVSLLCWFLTYRNMKQENFLIRSRRTTIGSKRDEKKTSSDLSIVTVNTSLQILSTKHSSERLGAFLLYTRFINAHLKKACEQSPLTRKYRGDKLMGTRETWKIIGPQPQKKCVAIIFDSNPKYPNRRLCLSQLTTYRGIDALRKVLHITANQQTTGGLARSSRSRVGTSSPS